MTCLIDALHQANASQNHTTVELEGGVYELTAVENSTDGSNGLPSIIGRVSIRAAGDGGATIARPTTAPAFRLMHVGGSGDLTLDGITLRGGRAVFVLGVTNAPRGGALFNAGGTVMFVNTTIERNEAFSAGSGVYNDGGTIKAVDSLFYGQFTSGGAGAALASDGGHVAIERVRIEGNYAWGPGGISMKDGELNIAHSDIVANHSDRTVGGIRVTRGTASIVHTTLSRNSGESAGGLYVDSDTHVVIGDSAFVRNSADAVGAAIMNQGVVDVVNTTFSGNLAGFITDVSGAVVYAGQMTITNSTFADSRVGVVNQFRRVFTLRGDARTVLRNTIIEYDTSTPGLRACSGPITSQGHNVIRDLSECGMVVQPTDRIGPAGLDALASTGTPGSEHHPLQLNSQAIDSAADDVCPKKDQLGYPRAPRCDVGAVEFRRPNGGPAKPGK